MSDDTDDVLARIDSTVDAWANHADGSVSGDAMRQIPVEHSTTDPVRVGGRGEVFMSPVGTALDDRDEWEFVGYYNPDADAIREIRGDLDAAARYLDECLVYGVAGADRRRALRQMSEAASSVFETVSRVAAEVSAALAASVKAASRAVQPLSDMVQASEEVERYVPPTTGPPPPKSWRKR